MDVTLTFRFPPTRPNVTSGQQISLTVTIPFPEQRPLTVANFLYLCTGELPSVSTRQLLLPRPFLSPASSSDPVTSTSTFPSSSALLGPLRYSSTEAAIAGGLPPLSHTSLMHVDLHDQKIIEFGSSTTQSIFPGGFLPDEPLTIPSSPPSLSSSDARAAATVARMQRLEAGTLLCSSIPCTPHTHASRYYLVLENVCPSIREQSELRYYAPLGFVTRPECGVVSLLSILRQLRLHPRTLAPLKKVELSASQIQLKAATGTPPSLGKKKENAPLLAPILGRIRPREEDEEYEKGEELWEHVEAEEGMKENAAQGFFHLKKRFPIPLSRRGVSKGAFAAERQVRCRRRLEGEDELNDLQVEENLQDEKMVVMDRDTEVHKPFDFFGLQEKVFGLDLDDIKHRQDEGLQRKMRRVSKQNASAHASISRAEKKRRIRSAVLEKINSALGRSTEDGSGASKRRGKNLPRRY